MTDRTTDALLPADLGRARGVFTTRVAPSPSGLLGAQGEERSAGRRPATLGGSATGSVSDGPYGGFNLAHHVGDDAGAVAGARARLAASLGLEVDEIAWMNQVHSATAVLASRQAAWDEEPTADALVLDRDDPACAGVAAVGVLVADCVPLLLASADGRVVAAVHAGRRGMLDGVVPAALRLMAAHGVSAREVRAAVGPCVCGSCYEVSEQIAADAAAREPASRATTAWGTPAVDVAAGVRAQLARAGVRQATGPAACTREDHRFYSYRRQQVTGRLAGVVVAA